MDQIQNRQKTLVYDIRKDKTLITKLEKMSLEGKPLYDEGFGKILGDQWWDSMNQKKFPVRKQNGFVIKIHEMKHGHFCWMKSKGKDKLINCSRTRIAGTPITRKKLSEIYVPGSHVKVVYAQVRFSKYNEYVANKIDWLPLEVWIAHPQEGDPAPPKLDK